AIAARFSSLIGDTPPKWWECSATSSNRPRGTPRPLVTFSRKGMTSSGPSGPPKDSQSNAAYFMVPTLLDGSFAPAGVRPGRDARPMGRAAPAPGAMAGPPRTPRGATSLPERVHPAVDHDHRAGGRRQPVGQQRHDRLGHRRRVGA